MPLGATNNPNGRPKGKPNKSTAELREIITKAISGEIKNIPKMLKNVKDDVTRLNLLIKLLPYVVPQVSKNEMGVGNVSITVGFDPELDDE